jgi:hypothetical protein
MKAVAVAAVMITLAGAASAQTLDDPKNDGKNPDNVLTYGMGIASTAIARSSRSTRRRSNAWCRSGTSASTIHGASRRSHWCSTG